MNETKIDNLISRGGTDGWNHEGDLDALTKTFHFESFEQGNDFVQQVGKFCETKDHHPEWQTSNGGKEISVRLTSHFANNKVTLFDFELADNMNSMYKKSAKFNMYSVPDNGRMLTLALCAGSLITFTLAYTQLMQKNLITDMKYLPLALIPSKNLPLHQLAGESAENHSGFNPNGVLPTSKRLFP